MSLGRWWRRLRQIRRASALDREMDEEMRFHLEMEAAELRSGGLEPGEARRQARLRFGGVTRHQDDGREARGILWARDFLNDARYALRTLRRAPVFAITAILTLAIGVGASATIFAFTDVYVFRPLPFPHGDRLVELFDVQGPGLFIFIFLAAPLFWKPACWLFAARSSIAFFINATILIRLGWKK